MTQTETVDTLVAQLVSNPPTRLTEARERLQGLLTALQGSLEEKWQASKADNLAADVRAKLPDYQALLADISIRVEGIEVVKTAVASLVKAEATAKATLDHVFKALNAVRVQSRVWNKLSPAVGATGATT